MKALPALLAPLVLAGCVVSADPGRVDGDVEDVARDSAVADTVIDSKMPDTTVADTGKPPVDTGSSSPDSGALDTGLADTSLLDTGAIDTGPVGAGCKLSDIKICGPAAIGQGCRRMGGGATACDKTGTGTEGTFCTKDEDCKPGHICDAVGEICSAQKNTCRHICVVGSGDCGTLTCKAFSEMLCGTFGSSSPFKYGSITYGGCV